MNLQSENINELAGALAKAQGKIVSAKKDKKNPFFKSTYADLSSVWDACRAVLSENGLAVIQTIHTPENKQMELVTTLAHSSGQWIKSHMPIITTKSDPQSLGSALTYYRRYALSALVGVAASDEDDDGNIASDRTEVKKYEKNQISTQQLNELNKLLSDCGDKYRSQVLSFIKKQPIGAETLNDLPLSEYSRVKTAAVNKLLEIESFKKNNEVMEVVNAG